MAKTTHPRLYRESFRVFKILSVLLLTQMGDAYEFKVGGPAGWTVPKDPNAAIYNQWAEKNRFQIGDTILFAYEVGQDSVLHVTQDDYTECNMGAPIEKFTDGHTVFKFNQSGPHYFISGVTDNCHKNEKMVVVVMADRTKHGPNGTVAAAPSLSPSSAEALPQSPPSPAPAGRESPSPPPGEAESRPTLAPSQESTPPRNDGYSVRASVVGGVVAGLFGSLLVFGI